MASQHFLKSAASAAGGNIPKKVRLSLQQQQRPRYEGQGSHLGTDHGLERRVLVLEGRRRGRRVVGHEVVVVVVPGQPLADLLDMLPQRGDGLAYEEQHDQPGGGGESHQSFNPLMPKMYFFATPFNF